MILCCGEALIDMLPCRAEDGVDGFVPHPGGSVYNTALALGRLGVPTGFFCGLSRDLFGQMILSPLRQAGVDTSLCPLSDRPTTLAFLTLADGNARYLFYDENTASRLLEPTNVTALSDTVGALFFGGISLVAEPCGTAFETILARASGRLVMLDPNIRPAFVTDEAAYRKRLSRMLSHADIVKVSEEDLAWLSGPGDPVVQAASLRETGPSIVIVTRGAAGATAIGPRWQVSVPARRVSVVDTVGAGDCFNAGFLNALHARGALCADAVRTASSELLGVCLIRARDVAAVSVTRPGANPPWAAEMS